MSVSRKRCWYCGCRLEGKKGRRPERDHVVPRSVSLFTFTVWACHVCNRRKDAKPLERFRRELLSPGLLFAGEQKPIGNPSFYHLGSQQKMMEEPLPQLYAAWFVAAAELSRRFDPHHREEYFRYAAL